MRSPNGTLHTGHLFRHALLLLFSANAQEKHITQCPHADDLILAWLHRQIIHVFSPSSATRSSTRSIILGSLCCPCLGPDARLPDGLNVGADARLPDGLNAGADGIYAGLYAGDDGLYAGADGLCAGDDGLYAGDDGLYAEDDGLYAGADGLYAGDDGLYAGADGLYAGANGP